MLVYLVGGKHAGTLGIIENVSENKIAYKEQAGEGKKYETLKEYAFVIGKDKPIVSLPA